MSSLSFAEKYIKFAISIYSNVLEKLYGKVWPWKLGLGGTFTLRCTSMLMKLLIMPSAELEDQCCEERE